MEDLGSKTIRRLGTLKALRADHERVWRECYEHSHPIRGTGFSFTDSGIAEAAKRKRAELLDSTSTDSCRILASSIQSGLTPANSLWFQLDIGTETPEEKRWMDDAAHVIWENIHASNFDSVGYEFNLDLVEAGWPVMFIDANPDGGYNFELWPNYECYCAASKPGGPIDIVYRVFKITIEQAVEKYGKEKLSAKLQEQFAQGKLDEKIEFVHAIQPRSMYAIGSLMAKNMPVQSIITECESKHVVQESGYHEKPVIVPRWMMIPGSVYAVGPMFDALPDVKELNEIKRLETASLDIAIGGMWIAEDDGVLNPRSIKLGARKVIVANSVDSMKELKSSANFNVSFTKAESLQASIRKVLMADQLQPQDGPAMTATEVHVRVGLIRQLLGPVYGRLQSEYLSPMIERCFGLALRAGALGRPPESLANRTYSVKYLSPLARAQKMEEVTAIQQLYQSAGMIAQSTGNTAILDNIDDDLAITLLSEGLGVPNKVMRKPEDVQKLRDAKQEKIEEAQQQAQSAAMMQEAGSAAIKKMAA